MKVDYRFMQREARICAVLFRHAILYSNYFFVGLLELQMIR